MSSNTQISNSSILPKINSPLSDEVLCLIGIGSSVGGLDELYSLVEALKPNRVAAFIVAHHLAAGDSINLVESLASRASLPVVTAKDGECLEAGHIYVIPPNRNGIVEDGRVRLMTIPSVHETAAPSIDLLFQSLANVARTKAYGVILSGSGCDGALGARAIEASGGIVLVQRIGSAATDAMPKAATVAVISHIQCTTNEIADRLNALQSGHSDIQTNPTLRSAFAELLSVVFRATQMDVTQYKEATLRRQVERRLQELEINTLEEYLAYVQSNPDELSSLQEQFLITVTTFFRDSEPFECLEGALRDLINRKKVGDPIRVWVPGCATGEEAYSIAILLKEILGEHVNEYNVQVFASDINAESIQRAHCGVYAANALDQVSIAMPTILFCTGWEELSLSGSSNFRVFSRGTV